MGKSALTVLIIVASVLGLTLTLFETSTTFVRGFSQNVLASEITPEWNDKASPRPSDGWLRYASPRPADAVEMTAGSANPILISGLGGNRNQEPAESMEMIHGDATLTIGPVRSNIDSIIHKALETLPESARPYALRRFPVEPGNKWNNLLTRLFRELSSSSNEVSAETVGRMVNVLQKWNGGEGEMRGSIQVELINRLIKGKNLLLRPLFHLAKQDLLDERGRLPVRASWRYDPSGTLDIVLLDPPPPSLPVNEMAYNFAFDVMKRVLYGEPIQASKPEPPQVRGFSRDNSVSE